MSDDKPRPTDETQPVRPEGGDALPPAGPAADGTAAPETASAAEPASTARRGFRERLGALRRSDGDRRVGLAALIASALAGLIVGGLGLGAVQAITDGGDRDRGGMVERRDDGGPGGRGGMHGGPRGVPGQLSPTTAPDDGSAG